MRIVIKILLLLIFTVSCSPIINLKESNNNSHEHELIDFLFSNEHLIKIESSDLDDIVRLNKYKVPLGDLYYYKYMLEIFSGNNNVVDILVESDKHGNKYAGEILYEFYFKNDFNKRIKYLEFSALKGNSSAQFTLGIIYYYGRTNFKKNKDKGIKYLEMSAMQAYSQAIQTLGVSKIGEILQNDKYIFWNIIYLIYEKEIEFDFEDKFLRIRNKQVFCNKFKEFVYDNEIQKNEFNNQRFPNSLKIMARCLRE